MACARTDAHAAVLLIDADDGDRAELAIQLRREGYDVVDVANGTAALHALSRRSFDLIVTEPKLPGFAGAHSVTALREIAPEVPIVVCARAPSVEQAVLCMKHGASEYLSRGAATSMLPAVVARAVERRPGAPRVDAAAVLLDGAHRADVAARAVELTAKALHADAHALALGEPRNAEIFTCREARRFPAPVLAGLVERAGTPADPVEPYNSSELRDHGLGAALVVPLRLRRTPFGSLLAIRRTGSPPFSAIEQRRAAEFADRLSAVLHPTLRARELEERVKELELDRDQTVQIEKLALARKLVGGVAHEINNPLSFVRANLEALRDYAHSAVGLLRGEPLRGMSGPDELVREIEATVDESQEGLRRIRDLIANFQLLSTPQVAAPSEIVELAELVDGCLATVTAAGATTATPVRRFVRETHERHLAKVVKNDLITGLCHIMTFLREPDRVRGLGDEPVRLRIASDGGRPCVFVFDALLEVPDVERAALFDPRLTVEVAKGQRRIRLDLELALAHQLLVRAGAVVSVQPGPVSGLIFRVRLAPPPPGSNGGSDAISSSPGSTGF